MSSNFMTADSEPLADLHPENRGARNPAFPGADTRGARASRIIEALDRRAESTRSEHEVRAVLARC
jgi:hypothetical protein